MASHQKSMTHDVLIRTLDKHADDMEKAFQSWQAEQKLRESMKSKNLDQQPVTSEICESKGISHMLEAMP